MSPRAVPLSTLAGIAAAAVLVLRLPPAVYTFYPRCPIRVYFHLDCPGCGATRAFAALLHGHLAEAFHLNALFVVMLPLLASYATVSGYRAWTKDTFSWPQIPPWSTYALLAVSVVFTAARNL